MLYFPAYDDMKDTWDSHPARPFGIPFKNPPGVDGIDFMRLLQTSDIEIRDPINKSTLNPYVKDRHGTNKQGVLCRHDNGDWMTDEECKEAIRRNRKNYFGWWAGRVKNPLGDDPRMCPQTDDYRRLNCKYPLMVLSPAMLAQIPEENRPAMN